MGSATLCRIGLTGAQMFILSKLRMMPSNALRSIVVSIHLYWIIGDIGTFFLPKCAVLIGPKSSANSVYKQCTNVHIRAGFRG